MKAKNAAPKNKNPIKIDKILSRYGSITTKFYSETDEDWIGLIALSEIHTTKPTPQRKVKGWPFEPKKSGSRRFSPIA